ncbi:MAG TPA: GxxExxY protein [Bryobacteraceae bacterium]|nr:GxxExxY protein [Bryobacteraceae bacterium]
MNADKREWEKEIELVRIVEVVIGAAYEVSNVLGAGFLEQVYEKALDRELGLRGLKVSGQVPSLWNTKGERLDVMSPTS